MSSSARPASSINSASADTQTLTGRGVLLLRGINVGGRHLLPMAALRTLLEMLGCSDVRTYVQSGNVACTAPAAGLHAHQLTAALEERFRFPVPVVHRTAAEWRALSAANPLLPLGSEFLHTAFFPSPLAEETLQRLQQVRTGDEQLTACGRELYLHLPHGVGRSKLALALGGLKTGNAPTMRNWRTITALEGLL